MDWFLYDNGLRHERVKLYNFEKHPFHADVHFSTPLKTSENPLFSEGIDIEHWPELG